MDTTNNMFLCDCIEFMRNMPDKSVDMVFTSPPFKDEDVSGNYWVWYDRFVSECMRVSAKVVCIIHSATKLNDLVIRYPPKRVIIWGKMVSKYSYRFNPIFVYQISENYKVNKYIWSDCFGVSSVCGKNKIHKYQDPEILYDTIIKMFQGCDSVFDPCMGSGTTAVACIKLGKKYIGCEYDVKNYENCLNRIEKAKQIQKCLSVCDGNGA